MNSTTNIKVIDGVIQLEEFEDLTLDNPPTGKAYLFIEGVDSVPVLKFKRADGTIFRMVGVIE